MRFPMLVHLVGFWLAGIPLGLWLAFRRDAKPNRVFVLLSDPAAIVRASPAEPGMSRAT